MLLIAAAGQLVAVAAGLAIGRTGAATTDPAVTTNDVRGRTP